MKQLFPETIRRVLGAPFVVERPVEALDGALWLYLHLVLQAVATGMVLRTRSRLAENLSVSEEMIDRWIHSLEKAKLLRVLSPTPYLAVSLSFWPGKGEKTGTFPPSVTKGQDPSPYKVPVGRRGKQQAVKTLSSKPGDGGAGEGDLGQLLGKMLPNDPAEVQRLIRDYPEGTIRRAIIRVHRTPESQIRKSRAALLRYLISKFARDEKR